MSAVACSRGWGACDPDAVQLDSAWYEVRTNNRLLAILSTWLEQSMQCRIRPVPILCLRFLTPGWGSQCNAEYDQFQFCLRFLTPGWSCQCKSEYPKRQNASPIPRAGIYTRLRMRNNFRVTPAQNYLILGKVNFLVLLGS